MREGSGHSAWKRPIPLLLVALFLAGLLTARLFFVGSGPARGTPSAPVAPSPEGAPLAGVRERPEPPVALPTDVTAEEPGGSTRARELASSPDDETALLFRVVDGGSGEPIETFEARLGQNFLRPLLDEQGRNRHHFPGGVGRFGGLIESRRGEGVTLSFTARGFEELRIPDLYVPPGHELDLGTLRMTRSPRLEVRVLDEATGAAVAGASVALLPEGATPENDLQPVFSQNLDPFRARTEDDGRVLLSGRPGERALLAVRRDGYAPLDVELILPFAQEHRETVRLKARLPE